jgi:hypothetical protein
VICAFLASPAAAQGELTRVFPNGAQRGTTVALTFGGKDIPETAALLVEGDGVKPLGPFTKGAGKVEIAADAAPGVRQLRLVGPKTATTPRPFSIGALPETVEKEPNDTRAQAQKLEALPVALNGSLPARRDIDAFRVALKKGECLVVAGESRALGAPTDLLVRIRDLDGRELLTQMDSRTRDPLLGFTAPADGDYVVELQDVMNNYSDVNADYVYRVTLTTGPWIDTVFPPGAQRGTTVRLTFAGWNLGGRSGPSALEASVAVPADADSSYAVSAGGASNQVLLSVGPHPELNETEPNDARSPQPLPVPITVSGVFGERGDRDWCHFAALQGQKLRIDVDARSIGSAADVILTLQDASGKTLATADDADRRGRDPSLLWTAPAYGAYRVLVRDIASGSRGGPAFYYRLTIAPPEPSLKITTPNPTLSIKPGAKLEIPLTVARSFTAAPVRLRVEGLPADVTAAAVTVPPSPEGAATSDFKLVLTAAPDATPGSAVIRITGRVGDTILDAPATAAWVLATDRSGTLATGATDRLLLLVSGG